MNIIQKNILIDLSETLFFKTSHTKFNDNLRNFQETKLQVLKMFLNEESINYIVSHLNSLDQNSLISNSKPPLKYSLKSDYCFDLVYQNNIFNIVKEAKEDHKKEKEQTTKYNNTLFDKIINKLRNFIGEIPDCLQLDFEFNIEEFIDNKREHIHKEIGSHELEWRILNVKKYNPGFLYDKDKKSYTIIDLKRAKANFSTALNNLNIEYHFGFILGPWKEDLIEKIVDKTQKARDQNQTVYIKQKLIK